ncbi:MAG: hypothetical protein PHH23_01700 [Paludibacteraceae bacterium]|nr:hypothetical protein [Paludibacteraceae bacterium]
METSLNNEPKTVDTSMDSVVIKNAIETLTGGRSLDVTGFTPAVIKAGHVIIKETSTGNYKPMPVNSAGDAYGSMPASHTVEGVCMHTVLTKRAMVGIMVRGTVNEVASPFTPSSSMKTALPLIRFTQD